jgi:hypothetical protein
MYAQAMRLTKPMVNECRKNYVNFKFDESYNKKIEKQFELVRAEPNHGFFNKGSNREMFDVKSNSVLYGFDLFYRRKNQT